VEGEVGGECRWGGGGWGGVIGGVLRGNRWAIDGDRGLCIW